MIKNIIKYLIMFFNQNKLIYYFLIKYLQKNSANACIDDLS